jgi:quercetin dioxygenase-like cupin family protein
MKCFAFVVTMGITLVAAVAPAPAPAQDAPSTTRKQLSRHDLSIPGFEEYQVRVDFPKGTMAPNHRHPGEEIIYVIERQIEYQLEGQAPVTLKAGDVLFVPARTVHSAKNVGTDNAAELGTYIVPKGKPLTELVK